jgi:unsaturated rhamnogalacturonyl hydrolase
MSEPLAATIHRVAQALIGMLQADYENFVPEIHRWDWMPGVGLYGLIRAHETLGETKYLEYPKHYIDRLLDQEIVSYSINGSIMFEAVLKLYEHTHDPRYEREMVYYLRWLLRSAPKCQNGCFEHTWTEVDVNLTEQVWIDTLFMAGIVLADSGRLLGRADCKAEALRQFATHQACLQDPATGFYRHFYQVDTNSHAAGAFWGRGNGWMAASVADVLEAIGPDDPAHAGIIESFRRQMNAVRAVQEPDGAFHTILNDKNTYVEMSATAALGYAALKGVRLNLLNSEFGAVGERALAAVLSHVGEDGIVKQVSSGTSGFIPYEQYNHIPIIPRLYGQALAILLMTEYLTIRQPSAL